MGNGSKGAGKYRSNSAFPGSDVQGCGAVGAIELQQELGGDGGDAQGLVGVPSMGGAIDHRSDGEHGAGKEL